MPLNKTPLPQFSSEMVKPFSVSGQFVRDSMYIDFTEGGNWLRYKWVPDHEVWLDDANQTEQGFVAVHELGEVHYAQAHNLDLTTDAGYSEAHTAANILEQQARDNPALVPGLVQQCLEKIKSTPEGAMKLMTQTFKLKDVYPDLAKKWARKAHRKADELELIRKGYAVEKAEVTEGERSVVSYINTACIDRDREVVLPEGGVFDDYLANPVVLFCHDYRQLPVGRCASLGADSKGVIGKTIYANHQKANEVYQYRKDGFPLAESIGFIPLEYCTPRDSNFKEVFDALVERGTITADDDVQCIHTKWGMLEYSDVPVPSNPEALQIAIAKGLVPNTKACKCDGCETAECACTGKECKDTECTCACHKGKGAKHPNKVTQAEIKDELDYLQTMVTEVGLNADNTELLRRLTGGDTPEDITSSDRSELVKTMISHCTQTLAVMDAHHKAHNDAYASAKHHLDDVVEKLGAMIPEDEDDVESAMRAAIATITRHTK